MFYRCGDQPPLCRCGFKPAKCSTVGEPAASSRTCGRGESGDPAQTRDPPDPVDHPSAVGINVKLHPSPTGPPSPTPPSPHPPHLARFSKFHKCHFIMRLSSLWHPPPSPHHHHLLFAFPLRSHRSQFFFPLSSLFYLSAPLPGNPAWILPSVFAVKKPHNWISYICLFLCFFFFFHSPQDHGN